jgi:NAD(P)-dependent dehydrogenase (short-subunit alcohol dehydrogenase family)
MDNRKTVLISGGTSGIGLACATVLRKRAWDVVIAGRDADRGRQALESMPPGQGRCVYVHGDVSSEAGCRSIVAEALQHFSRLDGLITSAGIYGENLLDDVTEEEADRFWSINVKGTMFLCKYALPYLKVHDGSIVTIASDAGLQGNVACSLYSATKGAVTAFSRSLALETAPHGVRVNCLCPGDVATPLLERQMQTDPTLTMDSLRQHYPLYRIAQPQEIATVAAFLLSTDASYVTAAVWPVDGGLTSW